MDPNQIAKPVLDGWLCGTPFQQFGANYYKENAVTNITKEFWSGFAIDTPLL
jgi:hypothetical protein